jgi:hypothetical protein
MDVYRVWSIWQVLISYRNLTEIAKSVKGSVKVERSIKACLREDSRPDDRDRRVHGSEDDAPCRWKGCARARQAQAWLGRAAGSSSAASGRGVAIHLFRYMRAGPKCPHSSSEIRT